MALKKKFQNAALVLVDVEASSADPATGNGTPETARIAARINKVAGIFRKAGVKIVALTYAHNGFFGYQPHEDDIIIPKFGHNGAVEADEILRKHNIKNIFGCGFQTSVCAKKTFVSLAADCDDYYKVSFLRDLSANDITNQDLNPCHALREMKNAGIAVTKSASVIKELKPKARNSAPKKAAHKK